MPSYTENNLTDPSGRLFGISVGEAIAGAAGAVASSPGIAIAVQAALEYGAATTAVGSLTAVVGVFTGLAFVAVAFTVGYLAVRAAQN